MTFLDIQDLYFLTRPGTANRLLKASKLASKLQLKHKLKRKFHFFSSLDIALWAMKSTGRKTFVLLKTSSQKDFFSRRKDREKKAVLAGVSFNSVSRIDSCAR